MLPIGNRPLLAYQIDYLERNGVNKIMVVLEKRYLAKVEKYMNTYFRPSREGTEVELIALSDEEESGNVLKLLRDRIVKDFVVLSGDVLVDVPLETMIDSHSLHENAVTVLLKEQDLKAKAPAQKGESETYDIFGLTEWSSNHMAGDSSNTQRIVFKSNSVESQNIPLSVKASLLQKCHKMKIRTDLQEGGVFIF
jgi:translation initiation factor eIF-2B subunit gamma